MQDVSRTVAATVVSVDELRLVWGFTPAEAKLAQLLLVPLSLQASAKHLGIGTETARTQLKALFGKTNTHRQSELLIKLLSMTR